MLPRDVSSTTRCRAISSALADTNGSGSGAGLSRIVTLRITIRSAGMFAFAGTVEIFDLLTFERDACHLARAQGVTAQPRKVLKAIPGLELADIPEGEICCGSAGIYNLVQPEPAAELGERKARNLLDTGADAVVAGNPGCALQITAHTERLGRRLPVLHPMELLARSLAA